MRDMKILKIYIRHGRCHPPLHILSGSAFQTTYFSAELFAFISAGGSLAGFLVLQVELQSFVQLMPLASFNSVIFNGLSLSPIRRHASPSMVLAIYQLPTFWC
ncbi:hypothetical protein CEXT_189841 [Caerostris extrusa]|uniref:Uncharacterized protein n=1 Tax=Caerostris extrusa TaxID=172846 RepID=A0AAV4QU30_CAEEX|nr:hypothetical protein CEXT_189841 [Caerostris extrusa]